MRIMPGLAFARRSQHGIGNRYYAEYRGYKVAINPSGKPEEALTDAFVILEARRKMRLCGWRAHGLASTFPALPNRIKPLPLDRYA